MASFITRIFKKPKSSPAPTPRPTPAPQQSAKPKTGNAQAAQAAQEARRGRARNRTVFTDSLGISASGKRDLQRKYLLGA